MPTCSDKPGVTNRDRPGRCFQKGKRVGFAAGVQTGIEQERTQTTQRRRVRKAIANTRPALMRRGKGELEAIARRNGISGARRKTKSVLVTEIIQARS